MHIPDGYLGPETLAVGWAACLPAWYVANKRTKALLSEPKAVPVLAASAAFSFLVMMLNVPVFGGTTAHAVGAVLIAVIAGPWVAVLAVTAALVIQALLFADGGILAIGINCLNMAVVMPLVGYGVYQLVAGSSDLQSRRRLVAAAVGAYVGILAAATLVGVELGIQPSLHTADGVAQYAPYGLHIALPAMLVSHAVLVGPIEAAFTVAVFAFLRRTSPDRLPCRGGPASLVSLAGRGRDRADRGRAARADSHWHGLGRVGRRGAAHAHRLRSGGLRPLWGHVEGCLARLRPAGGRRSGSDRLLRALGRHRRRHPGGPGLVARARATAARGRSVGGATGRRRGIGPEDGRRRRAAPDGRRRTVGRSQTRSRRRAARRGP